MKNEILDDLYYKAKMMTNDSHFKELVDFLLTKFEEFNLPVPKEGFKDNEEFEEWKEKYWEVFSRAKNSKEYNKKLKTLTKNKKEWVVKKTKNDNIYQGKRLDEEICNIINEEYGDLSWENIRKIISKMDKLDKKFVTDK